MTKRIFRSIVAVSLIAFLIFAVITPNFLYSFFQKRVADELEMDLSIIKNGVSQYGEEFLDLYRIDKSIKWTSADGDIIFERKVNNESQFNVKELYSETVLDDGSVIAITDTYDSVFTVTLNVLPPTLIALLGVLLFSAILARVLSKGIVSPINAIDLEKPQISGEYEEISPLVHKIKRQNELISLQMSDMKRRQQEFESITKNMGEGMVVVDNEAEILTYNKSALKILDKDYVGYGTNVFRLGLDHELENAFAAALVGKKSNFEWHRGDNVYSVYSSPVKVDGGISGAVIFILDVTESAHMEQIRREFTSNVSHELKTPLTSISGISEIMMNGIVKNEDIPQFAENIYKESGRLIALVNDIIKLSQLDDEGFRLEKENVDLLMVAKEARERLRLAIEQSNLTFKLVGESVYIKGVPAVLSEMVYNLCDNAIKYNKKNGSVEVEVGIDDKYRPFIRVSDTGIGIPSAEQTRIFERFYRVDKSHSREIGGTGLGLSIVKHAASFHNAEIKIDSKLNEGTTIKVVFKI